MFFENFVHYLFYIILYGALPAILSFYVFNRWISDIYQTKKRRYKGHSWKSIEAHKAIPYDNVCSICRALMLPTVGRFCEKCSLSACVGCRKKAERRQTCRASSASPAEPFYHHWVKVGATCDDCNTVSDDANNDFFCCWCQRIQHCRSSDPPLKSICDLGDFKNEIISPTSVQIGRGGSIKLTPPNRPEWKPIIIIGNPKSGGGVGEDIMSLFRGFLNPIQIIKFSEKNLKALMNWVPSTARIVVAGGDGSVSAVLTAIANKHFQVQPSVAVLPLGTGNDLSRVLGWGANCTLPFSPVSFLTEIRNATPKSIDRWSVQVGRRQLFAYNYVSIGVDARVALDFHRARLHPLYVRGSQWMNYLIYLCLGTQQVLSQDCSDLEKLLDVKLDGKPITLPRLQALLLLNIPSWGAGVDVWNSGADDSVGVQSYEDGKLEIIGINSSFHIAQLQVGFSQPNRIKQASEINIRLKGLAPMQVDGEPWEQAPCEISVKKIGSSSVLCRKESL